MSLDAMGTRGESASEHVGRLLNFIRVVTAALTLYAATPGSSSAQEGTESILERVIVDPLVVKEMEALSPERSAKETCRLMRDLYKHHHDDLEKVWRFLSTHRNHWEKVPGAVANVLFKVNDENAKADGVGPLERGLESIQKMDFGPFRMAACILAVGSISSETLRGYTDSAVSVVSDIAGGLKVLKDEPGAEEASRSLERVITFVESQQY